jgi:endonuclease/exonuclease/phosphatase family metal-dependent hydrolase
MDVTVGTFNLNNLFSRYNFAGAITELKKPGPAGGLTVRYEFTDAETYRVRSFRGALVKAKDPKDTAKIAERIRTMDVDVLAVQEVEHVGILREFNRDALNGLYRHVVLIEGNDPRFIDVGVLSKLPIGAIGSFQTAVHPDDTSTRVFGRDLLEVEILTEDRKRKLFTLYNTHLKSHFGDNDDGGEGKKRNDARRRRQAEMVSTIIGARQQPNSRFILAGDMNDPPDSAPLKSMRTVEGRKLFDALVDPTETRPAKKEASGHDPQSAAWTHRFKPSGQPPRHELYDHIWLSAGLRDRVGGAFIDRRSTHGGDGSDHDPAWVELSL